jgi:hypothetical protein
MHVGSLLEKNKINNKKSLQYAAFFDSALQVFLTSAMWAIGIVYGKGRISHRVFLALHLSFGLVLAVILLRASNSRLKSEFNVGLARRNLELAKEGSNNNKVQLQHYSAFNKPFLAECTSRIFYVFLSALVPYAYKNGYVGVKIYCALLALIALLTTAPYYNASQEREKCKTNCDKILNLIQDNTQSNDTRQRSVNTQAKPFFRSFVFCALRMASMGIAFMYSKGELGDAQFTLFSLVTSSLLAFLFLSSIKGRETNRQNLGSIIAKLEDKKSQKTNHNYCKNSFAEKICGCFPLIVVFEVTWVVVTTLTPYLYKKEYIPELIYYSVMIFMAAFSLLTSYPSTFQRVEMEAKSQELLAITHDPQVLQSMQSSVAL